MCVILPFSCWRLYNEQNFYDTLQDCVLYQLVTQQTRIRLGTDPHILDLILTNEEAMIQIIISYIAGLGSSDQTCIHFHLNCIATRSERHTTGYNYGKVNFNQMRDMLQEVDWDNKLKDLSVSKTWEIISELIDKGSSTMVRSVTRQYSWSQLIWFSCSL